MSFTSRTSCGAVCFYFWERFYLLFIPTAGLWILAHCFRALELGYLQKDKYAISMNRSRLIADAKAKAIELADAGYTKPVQRKDIKVLGKQGLGIVYAGANTMYSGGYISEHDKKISEKLGWVMCGGDLSSPTEVTEQYLLDLEREAFLSLCGERKTLERIQSIVTKGKPLRN